MRILFLSIISMISLGNLKAQDSLYFNFGGDFNTEGIVDEYTADGDHTVNTTFIASSGQTPVQDIDGYDPLATGSYCLSFDGTGDNTFRTSTNVAVSEFRTGSDGAVTISAWVNLNNTGSDQNLISAQYTDNGASAILFRVRADSTLYISVISGGANSLGINTDKLKMDGTWEHVAIILNESGTTHKIEIFLNGVSQGTKNPGNTPLLSDTALYFGIGHVPTGIELDGKVDEFFVVSRALSAAEILDHYTNNDRITSALNNQDYLDVDYSVYPNPSTGDVLSFDIPSNLEISKIELIDISGTVVKSDFNQNQLSISEISNGIYFAKITTSNNETLQPKRVVIAQ